MSKPATAPATPWPLRRSGHRSALAATLLALLSACASGPAPQAPPPDADSNRQRQAAFDQSQQRWHGASVQELIAKQGQPSSRARDAQGQWVLSYTRTAELKGPTGPQRFSCTVHYRLDAAGTRIAGHRIEGC